MKNSKIHKGLPQREIRDFLAMELVKSNIADSQNKKDYSEIEKYYNSFERAIFVAETDIKYLQTYIKNLKIKQAIITLIKSNGWEEYDVSDETYCDDNEWMNFIGTEKEYIKFCAELSENAK